MMDSQAVVKALTDVDPGFVTLTHTLFGPEVDASRVWEYLYGPEGVSKMSPAAPDLSTKSGRTKAPKATKAKLATPKQKSTIAQPSTKNTAPKSSAMAVNEPKKTSVMSTVTTGKAQTYDYSEVVDLAKRALAAGVDPDVVTSIAKSGATKAAGEAVEQTAKQVKRARRVENAKKIGGGAAAGSVGGYVAGEAGDKAPTITYTMPASKPTVEFYSTKSASDAPDEITYAGEFSKVDDDHRLAFGWASVIEVNGEPVVDRQGDLIDWEELEKSAYDYMMSSRKGGNMHKRTWGDEGDEPFHAADIVESFVVTPEKIEKMGLPTSTPVGWWLGMKIHDDESWEQVKKGERAGFSIHGRGRRRVMESV